MMFYSPLISFFYEFSFEVVLVCQKFLIEKRISKSSFQPNQKKKNLINIRNIDAFNNLNQVSHVFINENALLSSNDCRITGFLFSNNYIEINNIEKMKIEIYFKSKSQKINCNEGFLFFRFSSK